MNTGHVPEEHQEDYSFLQETIKDERLGPKKIAGKVGKWLGLGLVFGMAACVSFYALKPWATNTFQEKPDEVEIVPDDQSQSDNPADQQEESSVTKDSLLTIDDYYVLNNELKQVAQEARESVVVVSSIEDSGNWSGNKNGVVNSTSGLIVADNGRELLILAKYSPLKSAQFFQVEFADETLRQASFKQKDANLDMAVFSVAKDGISDATKEKIKIAELGNSTRLGQGRTLIAVGRPFGFDDGVAYGVASTLGEAVTRADGEYEIIVTDMPYSENGSGFLFDIYGKVMGYVDSGIVGSSAGAMVAYGISDITDGIEMMSNGKHVPYAGIVGMMVTEEASELYEIPVGLYVTEVEKDSPAMNAGIQSGDVITKIGKTEVTSLDVYHDALYELEAGFSSKFSGKRYGTEEYVDMDFTVAIGIKE